MKVFIASILTETNTFAPAPTGRDAFDVEHADNRAEWDPDNPWRALFARLADGKNIDVSIGLLASAQPSGAVVEEVYQSLRDELLADLKAAMPVDAVILPLHGAMVADGYPDCEGDIIQSVREIVGPDIPIGVELDPHCHFTDRMNEYADIIIAYKEYPHTDVIERFEELWELTLSLAKGEIQPVTAVADCRMVGLWHTTREPMLSFVQHMKDLEKRDDILSVSFGHGFPYGDVPEAGAKIWVVSDGDEEVAQELANELRDQIWQMRYETGATELSVEEMLRDLKTSQVGEHDTKPVLIGDVADNAGGGASSDSTFLLEALREHGHSNLAIGPFWDLGAIASCREAGLGAKLQLRIGGKTGPLSGNPVDLPVTVRCLAPNHKQSILGAGSMDCGYSVWVSTDDGTDIVFISKRQQGYATNLFTDLGVDLTQKNIIVVKSTHHFYADFSPLADKILYVSTPGILRSDFENIPYRHRDLDYWPRVSNPFAL